MNCLQKRMQAGHFEQGAFARLCSLLLVIFLLGCASWSPPSLADDYVAVEYFPESMPSIRSSVYEWATSDGVRIASTLYQHETNMARVALIYLHGIESHGAWFKGAGERLAFLGYDVYCLDRRGSGINREPRGFRSGDITDWRRWMDDIREMRSLLAPDYDEIHLIGLSWGGKQALAYELAYPREFQSLILITPGIRSLIEPGWMVKIRLLTASVFFPTKAYKIPIQADMFTDDPGLQELIRKDPLRLRHVTLRFLIQNAKLDRAIERDMDDLLEAPLLLMLAEDDPIIDNRGVLKVMSRGKMEPWDVHVFRGQKHSIQFDAVDTMVILIDQWIDSLPSRPLSDKGDPSL